MSWIQTRQSTNSQQKLLAWIGIRQKEKTGMGIRNLQPLLARMADYTVLERQFPPKVTNFIFKAPALHHMYFGLQARLVSKFISTPQKARVMIGRCLFVPGLGSLEVFISEFNELFDFHIVLLDWHALIETLGELAQHFIEDFLSSNQMH